MSNHGASNPGASSSNLGTLEWAIILSSVSVILLALFITVIALFIRAKTKHLRLLADLEQRGITLSQNIAQVQEQGSNRTRTVLRRNSLLPYLKPGVWGSLNSREDIGTSREALTSSGCKSTARKSQSRLSWPFARHPESDAPVCLEQFSQQRLSAINEGLAVVAPMSPTVARLEHAAENHRENSNLDQPRLAEKQDEDDLPPFSSEGFDSPSLHPQPLFSNRAEELPTTTIKSRDGLGSSEKGKDGSVIIHQQRPPRQLLHVRSGSRTAPEHPVPPLPIEPATRKGNHLLKPYLYDSPSRTSLSSMDSASSSILIGGVSPGALRKDGAQLKRGAKREWHKSVIIGPRPRRDTLTLRNRHDFRTTSPMRSYVTRYSIDSLVNKRKSLSDPVKVPAVTTTQRFSLPDLDTVEVPRFVRRSTPVSNIHSNRDPSTPQRQSRSRVSPNGSPGERRRYSVLKDVSGNEGVPSRPSSRASTRVSSTRSSNGNPFQWDPALLETGKPSALKGSPRARRGHKRQNCVRISLAPTILGPQSRSTTPLNIPNIIEESSDLSISGEVTITSGERSPPKTLLEDDDPQVPIPNLNRSPPKATPPAESALLNVTGYAQENKQGYFNFNLNLTPRSSPNRGSRCSNNSSLLSIPKFPSPAHNAGPPHAITTPEIGVPQSLHEAKAERASMDTVSAKDESPKTSSTFSIGPNERVEISSAQQQDLSYNTALPVFFSKESRASPVPVTITSPTPSSVRTSSRQSSLSKFPRLTPRIDSPPCSPKTILPPSAIPISPFDRDRATPTPTQTARSAAGSRSPSLLSPNAAAAAGGTPAIRLRKASTDTAASTESKATPIAAPLVAAPVFSTITALRRMNSEAAIYDDNSSPVTAVSSPVSLASSSPPLACPRTPPIGARSPRGEGWASFRAAHRFSPSPPAHGFHRFRGGNDENVPPMAVAGREDSKSSLLGGLRGGEQAELGKRGAKRRSALLNASVRRDVGGGGVEWRKRGGADWDEYGGL